MSDSTHRFPSVTSPGNNVGAPEIHGTEILTVCFWDSYDLGHCPTTNFFPYLLHVFPHMALHIFTCSHTHIFPTLSHGHFGALGPEVHWLQLALSLKTLFRVPLLLPARFHMEPPTLWWVWEPVPEQESRVGLAGSKASPADPHILQEPQVCDLVATVGFIEPPSHLVFIGLDAADIEGLL